MYGYDDDGPVATQGDAHSEWHRNAGVPSGDYGGSCPWDACGHGYADDYEAELAAEENARELAAYAPALRAGEQPAIPYSWVTYGPQPLDPWTAHWVAQGNSWEDIPEPPF